MAYSTITDIDEQLDESVLIGLTDDENTGSVNTGRVDRAIADADAEIDAYCGGRYPVPFTEAAPMVRKLSVDIALYNLFSRRSAAGVPSERKDRHDAAIRFLRDVAQGRASLGSDAPAASDDDGPAASRSADDRIFTLTTMEGF